jgi:short-subunit dehydrogenase
MRFSGNVVFITGASAGIGEELAKQFAAEGAKLVLMARRSERLEALALSLGNCVVSVGDVTRDEDIKQAVERGRQAFGKLDIVVTNAGFGVVGRFENLDLEDYRRQFETNYFGVLSTIKNSLEDIKATRGRIVIIGSVQGFVTLPGTSAYASSKFAVRAISETLSYELEKYGVSVTHIAPGWTVSEFRKVDNMGRFIEGAAVKKTPFRVATDVACREILRAVYKRKRVAVITRHARLIVFFATLFSWAVPMGIKLFGITGRPQPLRTDS